MITLAKLFLFVMVATVGACGIGTVCTAAYLYTGGVAVVDVETSNVDLFIPVPLRLVDVGLGVVRLAAPSLDLDAELDERTREHIDQLGPVLEELVEQLGSLPSAELVRVDNGTELVVVRSVRGNLRVEVDTPEARVRVSVPQRGVRRVSRQALALADL